MNFGKEGKELTPDNSIDGVTTNPDCHSNANAQMRIYYFSGTGNARHVAEWIEEKTRAEDRVAKIYDLSRIERRHVRPPGKDVMVGFVSPTHGFNFPPVTMYFIFHFPRTRGRNKAFIVNTRAGMKLGRFFLPGISGIALWLSALVLWIKGYTIVGLRSIDLPSNWISIHPSLGEKTVKSIYDRCRGIALQFAGDILSNKKDLRAFHDVIQDCLVAPISLLYFLVGRFVLAKSFYAGSRCTNCNACIRNCPVKAIVVVSNRPFWTYRCENCMRCMNECPERAIETGHGYLAALLFLAGSWILVYLWKGVFSYIHLDSYPRSVRFVMFVVDSGVILALLAVAYRIVHYLKRVPVLQQIIEYTSLTRYHFWKRYNPEQFPRHRTGRNPQTSAQDRERVQP